MNKIEFIKESNKIEGIYREPTSAEVNEFDRFMDLDIITVNDLEQFVKIYQPNAVLRNKKGLDVRLGDYYPPKGGALIKKSLIGFINTIKDRSAYENHLFYESIHPFTDCNGRSGRMLWAWQVKDLPLGFLHKFYYQTLRYATKRHNQI